MKSLPEDQHQRHSGGLVLVEVLNKGSICGEVRPLDQVENIAVVRQSAWRLAVLQFMQ